MTASERNDDGAGVHGLCERGFERVRDARPHGVPVLAFYAHVEADVKQLAEEAGFELVVPRSRMAREGAALVDRLSA